MNFDIKKHTILEVLHGSHAYGLATEESDIDIRGVAIPPRLYFTGFAHGFEQHIKTAKEDVIIYGVRKFFKLATACNPNVLEILYVAPERCLRKVTPWGERLIENRELFLSKKAKNTFSGYAISQLKRIQTHRRWLLNPPDHRPTQREFGLEKISELSIDVQSSMRMFAKRGIQLDKARFSDLAFKRWQSERDYYKALREWKQYQHWKKTRNLERAELERRYGYDCKCALHLVRLLRMGKEILTQGKVLVERPDREELLAVLNGAWSYDKLIDWAKTQDQELDALYESCTILPKSPDIKKLNSLCGEIVEDFLSQIK